MTKRNVLLDEAQQRLYPSTRHQGIAWSIARGDIPPEAEWSWAQAAAVQAYLDGQAETHDKWLVKVTECGNGHREAVAMRKTVDPWRRLVQLHFDKKRVRGEGDREASAERAARRAKQKVRQLCKALGCNALGTLTYRGNQRCRDLALKHWKEFVRRVRKVLPAFDYVAVTERQKRGAVHIHLAMRKLPARLFLRSDNGNGAWVKSWDVMRAIWRRVVGSWGGTFNESSKLGRGHMARCMRIANYLGKYVAKEFADDAQLNAKRYFASELVQPVVTRRWQETAVMADLIAEVFSGIDGELLDVSSYLSRDGDFFWLSSHAPVGGACWPSGHPMA